jgi:hypothetical protein
MYNINHRDGCQRADAPPEAVLGWRLLLLSRCASSPSPSTTGAGAKAGVADPDALGVRLPADIALACGG